MQETKEKVEMVKVEEYVTPLGFDVIFLEGAGGGKGKNNCKTDCR